MGSPAHRGPGHGSVRSRHDPRKFTLAGIANRMGWIDSLPGALGAVSHTAVIVLASALTIVEFLATLIPGVASFWETVHTAIRPPAAAALAVLTVWGGASALITAAALLGWRARVRHPRHEARLRLYDRHHPNPSPTAPRTC